MSASEAGKIGAVPDRLVAAGKANHTQAQALDELAGRARRAADSSGCSGTAASAMQHFANQWAPALLLLGGLCDALGGLAEGTAAEFGAADGR